MARVFDGTCRLCEEEWKGQGITSHVKRCLAEHANLAAVHHGLLLGIRADGLGGRYWMYLMVRPEASLAKLDAFLRQTWIPDCDQASVFEIDESQYLSTVSPDDSPEGDIQGLEIDIGAVLRPRMELSYLFDPMHPTELEITVYDPYPCPEALVPEDGDPDVVLVARNDEPTIECSTCEQTATAVCPVCAAEPEAAEPEPEELDEAEERDDEAAEEHLGPFACDDCRDKHDHGVDLLPIVNSPRMGICTFETG